MTNEPSVTDKQGKQTRTWIEAVISITCVIGMVVTFALVIVTDYTGDVRLPGMMIAGLLGIAVGASPAEWRKFWRGNGH